MPYGTLGQTSTDSFQTGSANYKYVGKFTLSASGELFSLHYKNYLGYATKRCRFVIYSDNAGSPGDLLYSGEETNQFLPDNTWMRWFPAVRIPLAAGDYHLGMHNSNSDWYVAVKNTTGTNNKNSDTYSNGPSDPFGTVDSPAQTWQLGCFATYVSGQGIDVTKVISYAVLSDNEEEEPPTPSGEVAMPQVLLF